MRQTGLVGLYMWGPEVSTSSQLRPLTRQEWQLHLWAASSNQEVDLSRALMLLSPRNQLPA